MMLEELVQEILKKLNRIDARLHTIETQQTLMEAAWRRQGTFLEEVNRRCMMKLGLECPNMGTLDDEDDEKDEGNNIPIPHNRRVSDTQ